MQASLSLAADARSQARSAGGRDLDAWITYVLGMIGVGWGSPEDGRRELQDSLELARAVAWRIRSVLGKLEDEHAPLARLLRHAVRIGTWSVYDPEAPVDWEL